VFENKFIGDALRSEERQVYYAVAASSLYLVCRKLL